MAMTIVVCRAYFDATAFAHETMKVILFVHRANAPMPFAVEAYIV